MEHNAKKQLGDYLSAPVSETIAVAISGRKNSKYVVDWALENLPKENSSFKLLYVSKKITSIPMPMKIIPISQVPEDIATAYRQKIERKNNEMLDIYQKMFARKKVPMDVLNVEGDDIAQAIAYEVDKGHVKKLVLGDSSRRGIFTRKNKGEKCSSKITEIIPSFCTVYAVSKGKLASVRKSSTDCSDTSSSNDSFNDKSSFQTDSAALGKSSKLDLRAASSYPRLAVQRHQALLKLNRALSKGRIYSIDMSPSRNKSVDIGDADAYLPPSPSFSDTFSISIHPSNSSFQKSYIHDHDHSWKSDTRSQGSSDTPSENDIIMDLELQSHINIELPRTPGKYAEAQNEASSKLNGLTNSWLAEPDEKFTNENREEASQREEPETKYAHDAREKENLQETTFGPMQQYKKFTWEEIATATSSFSEKFIIGQGASGTVYKCNLHNTTAAVKVLHSTELQRANQFQQELEVLSRLRNPYLLLLLGACPEKGCLVYEHMENGSLEDQLFRRNSKMAPIPWFDRIRIAWEIASGLAFLHNSKPEQIIHRDLKPANILLDHNLGSKISDVGLSKIVHSIKASDMFMFNQTALVGTLSYIDPEYQRTGVNSPKSDVYAFGMILLQLLTARTTTALTHLVEIALEDGTLVNLLDCKAGQWPLEEAKELAILGLSCAELRRKDRPDLLTHVLPTLERLRAAADRTRDAGHFNLAAPPRHFLCPITKIIMDLELQSHINIELPRTPGKYAEAQNEASSKLNGLTNSWLAEPDEKFTNENREEASQREEPETKYAHDAREKENLQETTFGPMQQYKKFTWEEIATATSSFSEKFIIGQGASGTVYKCNLHNTTAAVKVLHSTELQRANQFQQELEVLSRLRNPYLLLLLGACPEKGCLVYEHMENGSLEDQLFRRNSKMAPIPWFDRIRIAWEIASGLAFLHNSKPEQIIHRDLKPANILLDHNLGSKISDVGLSKIVHSIKASDMFMFNQTALVGTLSYIDPEYQRTGVNSPKSDVYAFGMILLQLLTARTTTALTHLVEIALEDGTLVNLLDCKAGQWPLEEAKELAILGLSCAELRRKDRPDLLTHVLPTLERLRAAADRTRDAGHFNLAAPPRHFLCPITKEVMNDPCVASDGYTYDRKSIETWLGANDKSPTTNVTLPTSSLITDHTLLSAILEWKSEQS